MFEDFETSSTKDHLGKLLRFENRVCRQASDRGILHGSQNAWALDVPPYQVKSFCVLSNSTTLSVMNSIRRTMSKMAHGPRIAWAFGRATQHATQPGEGFSVFSHFTSLSVLRSVRRAVSKMAEGLQHARLISHRMRRVTVRCH